MKITLRAKHATAEAYARAADKAPKVATVARLDELALLEQDHLCVMEGHEWTFIMSAENNVPVRMHCENCGRAWGIGPEIDPGTKEVQL